MIENVDSVEKLRGLARRKKSAQIFRTVPRARAEEMKSLGWETKRLNKRSARMVKEKSTTVLLQDRVWSLLYRMGFDYMSGEGGVNITLDPKQSPQRTCHVDVIALDSDVALGVCCRERVGSDQERTIGGEAKSWSDLRQVFAKSIHSQFPLTHKRVPLLTFFSANLPPPAQDAISAERQNIFDQHDLDYYEQLVLHVGPAAKYQFFADALRGRRIAGLEISLPAIKTRLAKYNCYIFSISPEYLLKIAYVSHRAKGRASDVDTYQRMIRRSRLQKIRHYITENGIFPTNIVISIEGKRHVRFDYSQQEGEPGGAKYGTLHLTPAYKSAWIIDGQHRLYGYSGHERAKSSLVTVLAFEALPPSRQAQLFIDINHEQKSVKRSLLQELYAELNWGSEDEGKRIGAIISKAIQLLNDETDSPLKGRILLADDVRSTLRCISLESLFRALDRPGFFVVRPGVEYGPFWTGDNDRTLRRALRTLKEWLGFVQEGAGEWWNLGAGDGGGLAMNDGVTVIFGVLRSVFQHFLSAGRNLIRLSDRELLDAVKPFGTTLGQHLGQFSDRERELFRVGSRGNQGQTAWRRKCERALHDRFSEFEPPGLIKDLELEAARTNERAYAIIQRLERVIRQTIVDSLRAEFGNSDEWWYEGVPELIRKKATERREEARGAGAREDYFDLIDFRKIVLDNWAALGELLGYGTGNKSKRTEWLVKLNEVRRIVMHPGRSRQVEFEQLRLLEEYEERLRSRLD